MKVAVVVQPQTLDDEQGLRRRLERRCARDGHRLLSWQQTTPARSGAEQVEQAVSSGADLVLVAGGDGTARVAAGAIAGSGVPLALLPTGTGNLLARNLDLPLDADEALDVALAGDRRALDVGMADSDSGREPFLVMAGVGLDAAMVAGAPPALKSRLGWPAYLLSGIRALRGRPVRCRITLDGVEQRPRRVRSVVVGNVGQLQAGLELLPAAEPDDGVLDVAVLTPRGIRGWAALCWTLLRRRPGSGPPLQRLRGRRVELRLDRPQRCQHDGDPGSRTTRFSAVLDPGALTMMVPTCRT